MGDLRSVETREFSLSFGKHACPVARMIAPESKAQTLQKRLVLFGTAIFQISSKLPKTWQSTHIAKQLLRAGTAAAANYGEARGAESRADFIHKLRIVLKELNETAVWLSMIEQSRLLPRETTVGIVAENEELCRIIGASIRTAGGFDRS